MKKINFTLILCTLGIVFTSCKDGKKQVAKQSVDEYTSYVDSVSNLDLTEAHSNWENIENGYDNIKSSAEDNIFDIKENEDLKKDITKSTSKFETYKVQIEEEIQQQKQQEMVIQKDNFRMSLLGENYANDDMKFEWINKDNILSVYQNFVDTTEANKDSYSREDWDEIKLLYEAIDSRKNTVENEGLSSSDNRKIAGLKLKFAPMHTLNRMGAKSEENANAKKN